MQVYKFFGEFLLRKIPFWLSYRLQEWNFNEKGLLHWCGKCQQLFWTENIVNTGSRGNSSACEIAVILLEPSISYEYSHNFLVDTSR